MAVNVLLPGSGLIVLQREWQGVAIALLYGVSAELSVLAVLVAPASFDRLATAAALGSAAVFWLAGQWALWRRLSSLSASWVRERLHSLRTEAVSAMEAADLERAQAVLETALEIDDEDVETNVCWAQLLTLAGRFDRARRAWHRVEHLDRHETYRREVAHALEQLPRS